MWHDPSRRWGEKKLNISSFKEGHEKHTIFIGGKQECKVEKYMETLSRFLYHRCLRFLSIKWDSPVLKGSCSSAGVLFIYSTLPNVVHLICYTAPQICALKTKEPLMSCTYDCNLQKEAKATGSRQKGTPNSSISVPPAPLT